MKTLGTIQLKSRPAQVWVAMLLLLNPLHGQEPNWWKERNVTVSGVPENNQAIATIGQFKWIATQAINEIDDHWIRGMNSDLFDLLYAQSWRGVASEPGRRRQQPAGHSWPGEEHRGTVLLIPAHPSPL